MGQHVNVGRNKLLSLLFEEKTRLKKLRWMSLTLRSHALRIEKSLLTENSEVKKLGFFCEAPFWNRYEQ